MEGSGARIIALHKRALNTIWLSQLDIIARLSQVAVCNITAEVRDLGSGLILAFHTTCLLICFYLLGNCYLFAIYLALILY